MWLVQSLKKRNIVEFDLLYYGLKQDVQRLWSWEKIVHHLAWKILRNDWNMASHHVGGYKFPKNYSKLYGQDDENNIEGNDMKI